MSKSSASELIINRGSSTSFNDASEAFTALSMTFQLVQTQLDVFREKGTQSARERQEKCQVKSRVDA